MKRNTSILRLEKCIIRVGFKKLKKKHKSWSTVSDPSQNYNFHFIDIGAIIPFDQRLGIEKIIPISGGIGNSLITGNADGNRA